MASNVKITPGMTPQQLDLSKRDLALNAMGEMGPQANLKRLEDTAAIGTGQRMGTALAQGTANPLAAIQQGGEQQDRTVALGKDQAIADGYSNQFAMIDEVKAGEEASLNDLKTARSNISARSNDLQVMGYYTDSDERDLRAYIANQIANLPYKDQKEIWMSYAEEMYDHSWDTTETVNQKAEKAFIAQFGPGPSQTSSPTAAV